MFKVVPIEGRSFRADHNEPANAQVPVIGHDLWKNRFGSDPAMLGKKIRLESQLFEVVGILPEGFSYPEGVEVWPPLPYDDVFRTKSCGAWYLNIVGRLKPGVEVAEASKEMATIMARLAKEYPDANEGLGGRALSLHEFIVGDPVRADHASGRGRAGSPHRVRQRGEPADRALLGAGIGVRGASGDGRLPRPNVPTAHDRERGPRCFRRSRGRGARLPLAQESRRPPPRGRSPARRRSTRPFSRESRLR